jgi:EpsI family protein
MNSSNSTNPSIRYTLGAILALCFFGTYYATASRLVKSWASYDRAHTILLLAIGLFLLWTDRKALRQLSPQPALRTGSVITLLGCLILIAGKLSNTDLLQDISLPITITGLVTLVGGFRYIEIAWLPITYLYFVFGLLDQILNSMSIYLQYAAAWTASILLELTGMQVVLKGLVIQLPHIALEVERGCSGQKHILALLALAVPVVYLRLHGWLPRLVLLVTAALVGVFGNGVRIAIIGLWTIRHPDSVHGPFDIFYVSFIFFFGTTLFLFMTWIAESYWPRKKRHKESSVIEAQPNSGWSNGRSIIGALSIGVLILCVTIITFHFWEPRHVILRQPLTALSLTIGEWSGQDVTAFDNPLKDTNPDTSLYRKYISPTGQQAVLNIAYFEAQNEEKKVVGYRTDWLYDHGVGASPLSIDKTTVYIGKGLRKNEGQELETVYFWFDIDGNITPDRYAGKMKAIIGAVTKRRTNGAIVLISFPQTQAITGTQERLFLQQVFPLIQNLLKQTI